MAEYDLYVINPVQAKLPRAIAGIAPEVFEREGYVLVAVSLERGREILAEVRRHRGGAYLLPVEYRAPRVSFEQAQQLALAHHRELVASGKRLGELEEGWDDIMWWSFRVQDFDATERDLCPDRITIAIDKLDGHVLTREDQRAWATLMGVE